MSTEADARMLIDKLLEDAGWSITNKAQVSTEEAASDGRADYLLKDSLSRPLAVLEAKRFVIDPYSAKEQAKAYAISLNAPFVILSNGQEHYFWDYADGDARPIMGFPGQVDLERRANIKLHRKGDINQSLDILPLPNQFIFKGEEIEARPYQLECLQRADSALIAGRRRLLFEMAAGTGRFLEIMASSLGYTLDEFASAALEVSETTPINSMCTVFAESEVISLKNHGARPEGIARSVHLSVAQRMLAMVHRTGAVPEVIFSGGVARNRAMVSLFEKHLDMPLKVCGHPEITGAVGAAIHAESFEIQGG